MSVFYSTNDILPESNECELIIIKILDDAFLSKYPRALEEKKNSIHLHTTSDRE